MVLRFSPPIALSDACRTARASCAEAVAAGSPSTTTRINSLRNMSPSRKEHGSVPWAYNPRNPNHEGARREPRWRASRAITKGTKKTQEIRDDDEEVGLPWTPVGSCGLLVAAGSRVEYSAAARGGGPARRCGRERAPGRLQRHAGAPGTPGDREVRPRQWQLAVRRTHAVRPQRSAGVRRRRGERRADPQPDHGKDGVERHSHPEHRRPGA